MNQPRLLLIAIVGMAYADMGLSAETNIDISLSEIYSSNIELRPDNEAVADFVTRISPSLLFVDKGSIIDIDIDYLVEAFFYADNSQFNEAYHQLDAGTLVRLIGNELTVSGRVVYSQINVDPLRPLANSNKIGRASCRERV